MELNEHGMRVWKHKTKEEFDSVVSFYKEIYS